MRKVILNRYVRGTLCWGLLFLSVPALPAQEPDRRDWEKEILSELIGYRSSARFPEETRKAIEAMARRLDEAGFSKEDVRVVTVPSGPQLYGLLVRYRGTGERRPVLFMAHIDVVDADPAAWAFPPFTFGEDDDYYYGRGTQDNKTGVATLVANFIRLRREGFRPNRDLVMALTGDEETNALVISWMVHEARDWIDAELAINTDAGGGAYGSHGEHQAFFVQTSEKVYQSFRLATENPGGHSSLPRADNAIYQLTAALGRLAERRFPVLLDDARRLFLRRSAVFETPAAAALMHRVADDRNGNDEAARQLSATSPYYNSMLRTTCVPTLLGGGHAENALPRAATAVVNCRILPGVPIEEVEADLRRVIADDGVAVERVNQAVPSPPSELGSEMLGFFEEVVDDMWPGTPVIPEMSTGATDGLYVRNAGIPVYGFSGYFSDPEEIRAHGLDERIGNDEYHEAVEVWYRLLKRLCQ